LNIFAKCDLVPGQVEDDERIVGGVLVPINEVPWQISFRRHGSHICGGSIISEDFIITAAHCVCVDATCVQSVDPSIYTIRAGSSRSDSGGQIYEIESIVVHKGWNPTTTDFDAAIGKMKTKIVMDANKQPIKMTVFPEKIAEGTVVMTSGFGLTQNVNEDMRDLRKVEVNVVSLSQCRATSGGECRITSNMLCAFATGKDSCSGGKSDFNFLFLNF
jgi:secreted trypsin-like serine protease